ncbi:MAG TPA: flagellar export protein FliJ [Beijerinckiaceae bacterium]|jgi:flagellar export protein FliJ
MKSRETLIRLKRFQVDEKRRRVTQIEMMIADFDRMAVDLDREIASEEQKAGISDPGHFAYPTYARAAKQRRDNLRRSAQDLQDQLDEAKAALGGAFEELKKVEILEDRERTAERALDNAREQAAMNQIGLARAARAGL